MKKIILLIFVFFTTGALAQIKIGDNPQSIEKTSLLELESSSKVLVISRVSEREMIELNPLEGAIVYNIDASCIYYYDGSNWNNLCGSGGTADIPWGSITGNLVNQTDIALKFQNYVDLSSPQIVAGEKEFTNKVTIDTGNFDEQVAEFNGRVKGADAIEMQEFVTKAQLDALGNSSDWGAIEGSITNQEDLIAEFQKFVDLTSAQSIGGEKTFTDKMILDTGNFSDQVAEFKGRVKGEEGTEPEDFVTKAQLDGIVGSSFVGSEGSIFFADEALGSPAENPSNLYWDNFNRQLRVGEFNDLIQFGSFSDNVTTLNIKGSISKPVHQATTLTEEHYTTIISWSTYITLPDPSTCFGRVYVIKIRPNIRVQIRGYTGYLDSSSIRRLEFPSGEVTQLQSNGYNWEQIN